MGPFSGTNISQTTQTTYVFVINLVCRVAYMENIQYVNLIEIGPAVIEIQGVENGELVVSVNKQHTCAPHSFLGC